MQDRYLQIFAVQIRQGSNLCLSFLEIIRDGTAQPIGGPPYNAAASMQIEHRGIAKASGAFHTLNCFCDAASNVAILFARRVTTCDEESLIINILLQNASLERILK